MMAKNEPARVPNAGPFSLTLDTALESIVNRAVFSALTNLRDQIAGIVRREVLAALTTNERPDQVEPDGWLSVKAAAELLDVHYDTMLKWTTEGRLPAEKAGRLLRIRRRDLEAFMTSSRKLESEPIDVELEANRILSGARK